MDRFKRSSDKYLISMAERLAVLEERVDANERANIAALKFGNIALSKAEDATKIHFEAINEQRGQIKDYMATVPTRTEINHQINTILEKLSDLNKSDDRRTGKSQGLSVGWVIFIGAIAAISSMAVILNILLKM